MAIIKWTPWDDMEKFFSDFPMALPNRTGYPIVPAVDIYETNEGVVVEMPLAGIEPEKVTITIENDVMHVSGEMQRKSEVEEKDYYRKEVRYGSFSRSIPLPAHVVGEKALAEYKSGMLKVSVPKAEPAKAKAVKIQVKQ